MLGDVAMWNDTLPSLVFPSYMNVFRIIVTVALSWYTGVGDETGTTYNASYWDFGENLFTVINVGYDQ